MNTQLLSDNVAKLVKPTALILPLMGVLITGIFILDLLSPLGRTFWLLYFLPLFLTFWFSHRQYLILLVSPSMIYKCRESPDLILFDLGLRAETAFS